MTTRYITTAEITHRQQQLILAGRQSRSSCTIVNIRQVIGSMFIAIGVYVQGSMERRAAAPILPAEPSNARSF